MTKLILIILLLFLNSAAAMTNGGKGAVQGMSYIRQMNTLRSSAFTVSERRQIMRFSTSIRGLLGDSGWVCWIFSHNAGTGTTAYGFGPLSSFSGTTVNTPTWTANGLTLISGSNQYVTFGNDATFQPTTGVGVAVCFSTSGTANISGFPALFSKSPGGAGYLHTYQIQGNDNSRTLNFTTGDGVSVASGVSGGSFGANTNKHFIVGSNAQGGVSVAKLDNGTPAVSGITMSDFGTNSNSLRLGRNDGAGANFPDAEYAFAFYTTQVLTVAKQNALYAIYACSLGSGYSLPTP